MLDRLNNSKVNSVGTVVPEETKKEDDITKKSNSKLKKKTTRKSTKSLKEESIEPKEVETSKSKQTKGKSRKKVTDKNGEEKKTIKKASSTKTKKTQKTTSKTTKKISNDKDSDTNKKIADKKVIHKKVSEEKSINKINVNELTDMNKYLFHQGTNYEAYNILGSHVFSKNGQKGVQFVTWAPNARDVFIVGDFNDFEVRDEYRLQKITDNGLWHGFFTNPKHGDKYKYCIVGPDGNRGEFKADPYAIQTELRPGNASIIYECKDFAWNDKKWFEHKEKLDLLKSAINIYEIHLGSWRRNENGEFLTYEEISKQLPKYLKDMGYTHVEIMPLAEHPLDASWGYQGTGYFSPTSRYGNIEGLKLLIDELHKENIGVIMDWAPGHFCKDAHGLYRFDGTPTYEYQEEWRAENKGWGTCNFDLGRREVKSYLISNALYWFREFHVDGLRVDAVSSILYLDYSRQPWEWKPNKYGDNGNLEAIDFLKSLNNAVFEEFPSALMIAEESTAWPNITKKPEEDGLGFNLKWNMGWMNDTLQYVEIDPKYRKYNHRNVTFAMMYNYAENYLLPLSHDEVVHGKQSLIEKMWGDEWNRYAGLRAFMGYMIGHPGKKLTFMGCEFAQDIEWREYEGLQWNCIEENDFKRETQLFFKDLNHLYIKNKALWEFDHELRGFNWIDADNNEQSILVFTRRSDDDNDTLIFVINFTSTVYYDYQIGVPFLGKYKEMLNSDDSKYGGSGQVMGEMLESEKEPFHNQPYSLKIKVPPMAALVLKVDEIIEEVEEVEEEKVIEEKSSDNIKSLEK